jgi:hypothetical protein
LLSEGVQQDLQRCDQAFLDQDLPAPFRVFLETRPVPEEITVPETYLEIEGYEFFPEVVHGWRATAMQLMIASLQAQSRIAAMLKAGSVPKSQSSVQLGFLTSVDLEGYLNVQAQVRSSRIRLRPWLDELAHLTHAMLYASCRSLREEPESRYRILLEGGDLFGHLRAAFYTRLATMPIPMLLGQTPRAPAEFTLAARAERTRAQILLYYYAHDDRARNLVFQRSLDYRQKALVEGPRTPEEDYRIAAATGELLVQLAHEGRAEESLRYLEQWRKETSRRSPESRVEFARRILSAWIQVATQTANQTRHGWPLSREVLLWSAREIRDLTSPEEYRRSTREALRLLGISGPTKEP